MKRILLLLIVLLSILSTKAQTPSGKTPIGSATLTQWNKGVQLADSGFQFTNFPDTFHLNLGWLKGIPNLLALVNDTFYVRNPLMTAWVKVGGSGGSGSALTLQNVITNGNVLTQNDTININSHFLSFLNGKVGIGSTGSPDLLSLSAANLASMSLKQSLTGQVFKIRIGDGTTSPVSQSFQIFDSSANKILLTASGDQFGIGNIPKGQYSADSKVEVFGGANGANINAKGDSTIVDQSTFEAENAEYDNSNQQSISIREYGNLFTYADTIMGFPKKATGVLDYLGNNYAIINVENNIPLRIGTNDSERIDITAQGQIKFIKQPLNETGTYKYLTIDAADSTVKQVSVSVPNLQSVTSAGNITTIPIQINGTSPFASQYVYLAPNEINFASIHGTTIYSLESYNNNENGTTNVSFMPNDPLGGSGNFLATSVNGHFANDSGQITIPVGTGTITALTGDVTASGTGSVTATLATVNSTPGVFGTQSVVPAITTNAKGLVTGVVPDSIRIGEYYVTNLLTDLAAKLPTAQYLVDSALQATINAGLQSGKIDSTTFSASADSMYTYKNGVKKGYLYYIGNAATVTTNANLTGDVTSIGNATTYNNIVPVAKGGTGTATPGLVAGTNVTITGSFPNQTINASGGSSSTIYTASATATGSHTDTLNGSTYYFKAGAVNFDSSIYFPALAFAGLKNTTGYLAFGDSYTTGYNATVQPDSAYAGRLARYLNKTLIDSGIPGAAFPYIANISLRNTNYNSTKFVTLLGGLNNCDIIGDISSPANRPSLNTVINGFKTVWWNQFATIPISVSGGAVTRTGTWATNVLALTAGYGKTNTAISTNTASSSVAYTVTGTSIGVLIEAPKTSATISINLDGVVTSYNLTGQFDSLASSNLSFNPATPYAPIPFYFSGLTSGSHTLTITNVSGGFFVVDYFASLTTPSTAFALEMSEVPYLDSTGWSQHGGSKAATDTVNSKIDSLFATFPPNFPCTLVKINSLYIPIAIFGTNSGTLDYNDHLHPTNLGHNIIFKEFVNRLTGGNLTSGGFKTIIDSRNNTVVYVGNDGFQNQILPYSNSIPYSTIIHNTNQFLDTTREPVSIQGDNTNRFSNVTKGFKNYSWTINGGSTPDIMINQTGFGDFTIYDPTIVNNSVEIKNANGLKIDDATGSKQSINLTKSGAVANLATGTNQVRLMHDSGYFGLIATDGSFFHFPNPSFANSSYISNPFIGYSAVPSAALHLQRNATGYPGAIQMKIDGGVLVAIPQAFAVEGTPKAIYWTDSIGNRSPFVRQVDLPTTPVIVKSAYISAQTSAQTICSYTTGAADSSYQVSAYVNVTALSANVVQATVSYTDETNTSRTATFFPMGATSATLSTGNSNFPVFGEFRVKASTTITVAVTDTGVGSATYNASASITRLHN